MLLSVLDRLSIIGLKSSYPQFGAFIEMRAVNDLLGRVGFSEEELRVCNFQADEKTMTTRWNPEVPAVEIEISSLMAKIIVGVIEKASGVPLGMISLYDRLSEIAEPKKE